MSKNDLLVIEQLLLRDQPTFTTKGVWFEGKRLFSSDIVYDLFDNTTAALDESWFSYLVLDSYLGVYLWNSCKLLSVKLKVLAGYVDKQTFDGASDILVLYAYFYLGVILATISIWCSFALIIGTIASSMVFDAFDEQQVSHSNILQNINPYFDKERDLAGVCFGFSCKFIDAALQNDEAAFYRRLAILNHYKNNTAELTALISDIRRARTKAGFSNETMVEKGERVLRANFFNAFKNSYYQKYQIELTAWDLLEIPAFIESIYINQRNLASKYSSLDKLVLGNTGRYDFSHQYSCARGQEGEPPLILNRSAFCFSQSELGHYFAQVAEHLEQGINDKVAIKFSANHHAVSIIYQKGIGFQLMDINYIRTERDGYDKQLTAAQLAELLFYQMPSSRCSDNKPMLFGLEYIANKACQQLTDNLQILKKQQQLASQRYIAYQNKYGQNLLSYLITHGDIDEVKAALALGYKLTPVTDTVVSPLQRAAKISTELTSLLLASMQNQSKDELVEFFNKESWLEQFSMMVDYQPTVIESFIHLLKHLNSEQQADILRQEMDFNGHKVNLLVFCFMAKKKSLIKQDALAEILDIVANLPDSGTKFAILSQMLPNDLSNGMKLNTLLLAAIFGDADDLTKILSVINTLDSNQQFELLALKVEDELSLLDYFLARSDNIALPIVKFIVNNFSVTQRQALISNLSAPSQVLMLLYCNFFDGMKAVLNSHNNTQSSLGFFSQPKEASTAVEAAQPMPVTI